MTTTIIACICSVCGTVVTVVLAVGKPLIENTKTMTQLTMAIKHLTEEFKTFETGNHEDHKRIHNRIDESEKVLSNHETRIQILEKEAEHE